MSILEVSTKQDGGDACDICHSVIDELVSEFKNNVTSQHIKSVLKGMCAELPTHLNDEVRRRNQEKNQTLNILIQCKLESPCFVKHLRNLVAIAISLNSLTINFE